GGLMLLGIAALVIFSYLQFHSKKPMLNLSVFKDSSFVIAVIISIGLYLISMGNSMVLPLLTKSICGYSDSSYGFATLVGSILSVITTFISGTIYDKKGVKPTFIIGAVLFAAFSLMGILTNEKTSIIYIAVVFALQSVAMAVLNSPVTTMALSNLTGSKRIDGSAVFNTLRQIASSLASTLSVLIFTLAGSDINAVHIVYIYYGIVTIVIVISFLLYMKSKKKHSL
ncbi:MAG: MFS transporter, partial [Eubacterium sp.]|nr:MFS transporter [Eubacterium sp.]